MTYCAESNYVWSRLLRFTTLKTVCLVALAVGKCHSEIHAITRNPTHRGLAFGIHGTGSAVVAKTQLNNRWLAMWKGVTITVLTKQLPSDRQEGRFLCRVRALRFYHRQTQDIRPDQRKLFISLKKDILKRFI